MPNAPSQERKKKNDRVGTGGLRGIEGRRVKGGKETLKGEGGKNQEN